MPSASPLSWQTNPIRVMANAIRSRQSILDASDTGTGKTYVTLFAAKETGRRVGVICPKSAIAQWHEAAGLVGVPTIFVKNVEALRWEKPPQFLRKAGKSWQWRLPSDALLVVEDDAPDAFLSGGIVDVQSRYNLRNLIDQGRVVPDELKVFQRLCESVGVSPSVAAGVAEGLE